MDANRQHDRDRQRYDGRRPELSSIAPNPCRLWRPRRRASRSPAAAFANLGFGLSGSQLLRGDDLPRPGTRDVDEFERHLDHSCPYPTNDTASISRTPAWTEGGKHHREGVQPARKHRIFSVDADRQHDTGRQRYATSARSEFHKPKSHRPGVPAVDLGTTYRRRFRQSGLRAIRSQLLRGDDLPRPGTRDVDEFERHLDHSSVSDQRHQYLRTPAWTEGGKHHREGVQPARKHRIFSVDADRQHDADGK